MNSLWNAIKFGLLSACCALALSGCGQTGSGFGTKDEKPTSAGSPIDLPSVNTSTATSAIAPPGAVMNDAEITEGSYNTIGDEVIEEGSDPTVQLTFTLNKPLAKNAKITAIFDKERSDCNDDVYLVSEEPVLLNKGDNKLSLSAMVYRDINPEDNCDAQFSLSLDYGSSKEILIVTGKLRVKDDDIEKDRHISADVFPGDHMNWYLNGDKKYDGSIYTVTQLNGPKVNFKVVKDRLQIIVPDTYISSIEGRTVVMLIKPSNAPEYKTSFLILDRISDPTEFENTTLGDGDGDASHVDFLKSITSVGYVSEYLAPENLLNMHWKLNTQSSQNRVVIDYAELTHYRSAERIAIAEPDQTLMRNFLQLGVDGRTLSIKPEAVARLQRYMSDAAVTTIWVYLKIYAGADIEEYKQDEDGKYTYEEATVILRLRLAPRKVTVHLEGINEQQAKAGDYRLALREKTDDGSIGITRVVPVFGLDTVFEPLYQGVYEILLVDFAKGNIAVGILTLDEKSKQKTYNLMVDL